MIIKICKRKNPPYAALDQKTLMKEKLCKDDILEAFCHRMQVLQTGKVDIPMMNFISTMQVKHSPL